MDDKYAMKYHYDENGNMIVDHIGEGFKSTWLSFPCPKCKARVGYPCHSMQRGLSHKHVGAHDERLAMLRKFNEWVCQTHGKRCNP
jgi:hypothetical protein